MDLARPECMYLANARKKARQRANGVRMHDVTFGPMCSTWGTLERRKLTYYHRLHGLDAPRSDPFAFLM
jgi:hypothetical protein